MTQSPGEPHPLDLYGEKSVALHRPRLAAAACWIMVVGSAMFIGCDLLRYQSYITGFIFDRTFAFHIQMAGTLLGFVVNCLAALLVGLADIARGQVNPWPRRMMVLAKILVTIIALVAYSVMWAIYDPAGTLPGSNFNVMRFYYGMGIAGEIFLAAFYAFGLIYLMQVAGWIKSRSLANCSLVLLGCFLLKNCAQATWFTVLLLRFFGTYLPLIYYYPAISRTLDISGLVLSPCMLCFLIVLARRLGKSAAR
jgi:uncharacterized membrane protein